MGVELTSFDQSNEMSRKPKFQVSRPPYKRPVADGKDKKREVDVEKLVNRMDPLSAQVYGFQKSTEQTTASLCEKLYLRDLLYYTIAPHFSGCGLYIVGSTLNGFGNSASDMDLCLMITPREVSLHFCFNFYLNVC